MMKGETTFERPWLASWPEGVPKSIDYPEISVHELLRRAAKDFGNRPAITFYGRSLSYRDLDAAVDRFAAGLRPIGRPRVARSPEHAPLRRRVLRGAPCGRHCRADESAVHASGAGEPLDRRGRGDSHRARPVLAQRIESSGERAREAHRRL